MAEPERDPWVSQRTFAEGQLDRVEQRLGAQMREAKDQIRESRESLERRIAEIKEAVSERMGRIERNIGELQAGKADKEDVANKADKWAADVLKWAAGIAGTTIIIALMALILNRPAKPIEPPPNASEQSP